jgi:hypothetical protein
MYYFGTINAQYCLLKHYYLSTENCGAGNFLQHYFLQHYLEGDL